MPSRRSHSPSPAAAAARHVHGGAAPRRRDPGGDLPPPTHPGRARTHLDRLPPFPPHHHRALFPPPLSKAPPATSPRIRGQAWLPPSPGAPPLRPLAHALDDAADFTYSFVPKPSKRRWIPREVRDGRVLLEEEALDLLSPFWKNFSNLAVCDPLSRRYLLLPPIPEDLSAAWKEHPQEIVPILAPIGDDKDEMSFKVICFGDYKTKLVAFVFSSLTGQWCIAASPSLNSLGTSRILGSRNISHLGSRGLSCFDNVRGCFYSASPCMDKLLVLDTQRMEFSTVNNRSGYHMQLRSLPGQAGHVLSGHDMPHRSRPGQCRSLPPVVVGREGAIEMFSVVGNHSPNGSFDLYHTTQLNKCESSKEWQLENIIPLPSQYDYFTSGAAEGFLFLGATTEDQLDFHDSDPLTLLSERTKTHWDVDYFSLDVRTSELVKVCRTKRQFFYFEDVYWYFGFPPSLSKPSI